MNYCDGRLHMMSLLNKPTMPIALSILVLIAATGHGAAGSTASARLRRASCIPLEGSVDSLCLFRDEKLDSLAVDSLWLRGEAGEFKQSELRRRGPNGKSLVVRAFAPLSTMSTLEIAGRRWGLVTEDLSCGAGSYAGPATHVLDLSRPMRIIAARDQTGAEIILASTLKTVWKSVPDGFLMASCRPEFSAEYPDSIGFAISYDRYRWSKGRWLHTQRRASGFDEFEDGVPDTSLFPR